MLWFGFREGLQQAHLVVKTLGSGFHIPAEGVHYLSTVSRYCHRYIYICRNVTCNYMQLCYLQIPERYLSFGMGGSEESEIQES